jgi:hypothetical protein
MGGGDDGDGGGVGQLSLTKVGFHVRLGRRLLQED